VAAPPPPAPGPGESRLPALLSGAHALRQAPSRWWARSASLAGLAGAGVLTAGALDPGPSPWGLGGIGLVLAMALLRQRGTLRGPLYPYLGRMVGPWRAAGATPLQLEILDEAHRLYKLTPPVGYRDRRTVVNPLGDAYAIFTSPAWRDPWLADRKLAIDPVVEAAEILAHLHRVTALLTDLRQHLRALPEGSAAARTYRGYEQALLGSLDDGLRRARALTAYRAEVARLETVLSTSRALAEAQTFGDRVLDVVSESVRHELATAQLDSSRDELRSLEGGLREITEQLGGSPALPPEPAR